MTFSQSYFILYSGTCLIKKKIMIDKQRVSSTSTFTLLMSENETMNASVNKSTIDEVTGTIPNKCSINIRCTHYYKHKGDFTNFRLSWNGEKSNCKPQYFVGGSVHSWLT